MTAKILGICLLLGAAIWLATRPVQAIERRKPDAVRTIRRVRPAIPTKTSEENTRIPQNIRPRPLAKWKSGNESNIETAQRLEWDWDCELLMRFMKEEKLTADEAEEAQRIVDAAYAHRCAAIEKLTQPTQK